MNRIWGKLSGMALSALLVFGHSGCESSKKTPHDFGENDPNTILCVGDSITYGYGVPSAQSYPNQLAHLLARRVINAGVSGEKSWEGRDRFASLLDRHKPGYVLILYGANDVIFQQTTGTIDNLRFMVEAARARQVLPIVATLTPAFGSHAYMQQEISNLNPRIRQFASAERIRLADLERTFKNDPALLLSDGLHPNAEGMRIIALTFFDKIDE